jgi:23S rRNA pseudouridine1911/1915/1917 synthase
LAKVLKDLTRTQIQRLIQDGYVIIDGVQPKASTRLVGGEHAEVFLPKAEESAWQPEAIVLDIRYEDEDLILVNKPAGMVVHPSIGHKSGTLVNAILAHCPDLIGVGGVQRPGIVHRLDKDTSGLILIAKNDFALQYLQAQFKNRTINKLYKALVEGSFILESVLIDAPIGRDPRNRKRMSVIPHGSSATAREAETHFSLIQRYESHSLLACKPLTGRTHQIRVHLAYAGYPIVGDAIYGYRKQKILSSRHFLHASELAFQRPSDRQIIAVTAELPQELQVLLDQLAISTGRM